MINYTTTTIQKEGTVIDGKNVYNLNITIHNNNLVRLHCEVSESVTTQQPDGNGGMIPVDEPRDIGHITLEHGRQVAEIVQGEDLIPHLTKFNEFLDEVLGKEPEVTKKTTK